MTGKSKKPVNQLAEARERVRAEMEQFRALHPVRRFLEVPQELTDAEARRTFEVAAHQKRMASL